MPERLDAIEEELIKRCDATQNSDDSDSESDVPTPESRAASNQLIMFQHARRKLLEDTILFETPSKYSRILM